MIRLKQELVGTEHQTSSLCRILQWTVSGQSHVDHVFTLGGMLGLLGRPIARTLQMFEITCLLEEIHRWINKQRIVNRFGLELT